MGAALYIALETNDSAVDNVVDGKALSRAEGELANLARRLGVRPPMEFFSMSPERFEADVAHFNPLAGIEPVPPFKRTGSRRKRALRPCVHSSVICRSILRPFRVPMRPSRSWRTVPARWRKLASAAFDGISVWTIETRESRAAEQGDEADEAGATLELRSSYGRTPVKPSPAGCWCRLYASWSSRWRSSLGAADDGRGRTLRRRVILICAGCAERRAA